MHCNLLDKLQNKEGLWMSDEEWQFQAKDHLIYILNISKTKALRATNDGEVILEDFKKDKDKQLWKKGESNVDGYFTLENFKLPKVMTAISSSRLEIQGNTSLRWPNI